MYCVESLSEGAAGSTYTSYTYTTLKKGNLVKVNFTLRFPQCDNYDDPQKSECKQERTIFNPDSIVTGLKL